MDEVNTSDTTPATGFTRTPFRLASSDPSYAGQAAYTRWSLKGYDALVLTASNRLIWRCPTPRLLAHYDSHVGTPHLDIGPGTGYYLDRCRFGEDSPRITLLDPNPAVLEHASSRIARFRPTEHGADALRPLDLPHRTFRSVGINYVLHCLPGDIAAKAKVLDHVLPLVAPGGVVFGSTIVSDADRHTWLSRRAMGVYNAKGIFSNEGDDLAGLERELAARFPAYDLETRGAVTLFAGYP